MPDLGKRIKKLRNEFNLSQEDFGDIFGIVKSTVSMYETGKSTPNDEIKKKIAEYFDVSLDWLMGRTDVRNVTEKEYNDKIIKTIQELGPDVTLHLCDLKKMTPEEKETLIVFLEGLKARRDKK